MDLLMETNEEVELIVHKPGSETGKAQASFQPQA